MADENGSSLHIVVFPWLAFGHMLPFLELSKSLARKGHRISFISTPRNIQRLPKIPPQISHLITFIALDLPKTEGLLCEAAEATSDLPPEEAPYLKKAFDGLERPFSKFIKEASPKPDWIIQDVVQYWIPRISSELGVPCIYYVLFPAADLVFFGPARSCRELESECLVLLEKVFKKPVIPVGLLPPSVDERSESLNESGGGIMAWLDKQRSTSVVYVALGTQAAVSIELLHELASGLEAAKMPFIWALRRPFGIGEDVEILPQGFTDRTKDFGFVAMGLVPQVKILAHESVGGFLTHCGWSSTIEGLQSGHPLVMLPIDLDQGLNARLMEEKGLGVEVARNEEDGTFTREDVSRALRLIMVDDEGEPYRKNAREMMAIVANKEWHEK